MEKYFNDAIIGNKNMLASFTKKGELIRLFYPTVDYRQFIDFLHTGVKVNDSNIIYLHTDINNEYEQTYVKDTNILVTNIKNTYFEINRLGLKEFTDENGVYVYTGIMRDSMSDDVEYGKDMNIVMRLKSGTEFEMSFEVY